MCSDLMVTFNINPGPIRIVGISLLHIEGLIAAGVLVFICAPTPVEILRVSSSVTPGVEMGMGTRRCQGVEEHFLITEFEARKVGTCVYSNLMQRDTIGLRLGSF